MSTICDLFRESFLLFFTLEHKVLTHSWLEQIIDVAVSLAKRADVDRSLGIHDMAISGFQEALNCLESMKLDSSEAALEQRVLFFFVFSCFLHQALQPLYFKLYLDFVMQRLSVLEFLHNQLEDYQSPPASETPDLP